MTITIGSSTFDNVFYDVDVDVLYLHIDHTTPQVSSTRPSPESRQIPRYNPTCGVGQSS